MPKWLKILSFDVFSSGAGVMDQDEFERELLDLIDHHKEFRIHDNGTISMNLENPEAQKRLIEEVRKFENFEVVGRV
ncbi:hypothetical protein Q3O60_13555 [Alkalimonas collagenimarina]|uniref:Uncharacterized protein n=1 Tax=Alkalimonas collagenimarina TaxID=400390 RepID=A0ABT9H1M2_9GAMM|nr:hypothetical protein [Alkalimonas collagenimarina]MDP4537213.1 hypothetical protein [Alkalimonas collagenimarina]